MHYRLINRPHILFWHISYLDNINVEKVRKNIPLNFENLPRKLRVLNWSAIMISANSLCFHEYLGYGSAVDKIKLDPQSYLSERPGTVKSDIFFPIIIYSSSQIFIPDSGIERWRFLLTDILNISHNFSLILLADVQLLYFSSNHH